jgi:hypothetical protein
MKSPPKKESDEEKSESHQLSFEEVASQLKEIQAEINRSDNERSTPVLEIGSGV